MRMSSDALLVRIDRFGLPNAQGSPLLTQRLPLDSWIIKVEQMPIFQYSNWRIESPYLDQMGGCVAECLFYCVGKIRVGDIRFLFAFTKCGSWLFEWTVEKNRVRSTDRFRVRNHVLG